MSTLRQRNRVFASPWYQTSSTSPGIAQVRQLANRTDFGSGRDASVDTWEQLRFVLAQAKYLSLIAPANYEGSGCSYVILVAKPEARSGTLVDEPRIAVSSIEEQIAAVKSSLSLQVKELAEILGVERPTIYSWINSRNTPRPASREKLFALYALAQSWNRLSVAPLGSGLHEPDEDGITIFHLLQSSRLPKRQIAKRLIAIAQARGLAEEQPRHPTSKLSLRDLVKKHGMDYGSVADQHEELDLESGKRISHE